MTKYVKGKDGKFAGSIGDGKNKTPSAPGTAPIDPRMLELRNAMAAAHVPSKMSIFNKTLAQAGADLKAAEDTRRAYWEALLEDKLHIMNQMASKVGQPPVTPAERALIIDNANILYETETADEIHIVKVNRNFASAVGATLFSTGARLQQRGIKGWIASRAADTMAKRIAAYRAENSSN